MDNVTIYNAGSFAFWEHGVERDDLAENPAATGVGLFCAVTPFATIDP